MPRSRTSVASIIVVLATLVSCATPPKFSNDLRVIYFIQKPGMGRPIGLVEGEDCDYKIKIPFTTFAARTGTARVRKAIDNARRLESGGLVGAVNTHVKGKRNSGEVPQLRYLTNVTIEDHRQNFFFFDKSCMIVTGNGFL